MKRISIWIKSFSLVQQFAVIAFSVVALFVLFSATTLSYNIDSFVEKQMYTYLHRSQESYFRYNQRDINDGNVYHYLYDIETKEFINTGTITAQRIVKQEKDFENGTKDGKIKDSFSAPIIYSVSKSSNNRYLLISIISETYRNNFKNTLLDSVVVITVMMISFLFLLMAIWVLTLIRPLDQIKHYIDSIRLGENVSLNIERGDEIGEVAEAIVDMQEEVSRQQSIREEMIQNISHDLKTPIATIKSYGESIKDGIYPYDTLEKSVDVIIDSATRLEKKVYSLITFNKFCYLSDTASEAKQLPMVPIIKEVLISVQVLRPEIKLETDLKDGVSFKGEEEAWRIVVENLLDNALRYSKSYVKIRLRKNLLEIYNDGEQMPQDRIDKLFKPYEKGTGGNFGLGLSIVKRATEAYGYIVTGGNTSDGVVFRIYPSKTMNKKEKRYDRNNK